jgi:hypothetical protein
VVNVTNRANVHVRLLTFEFFLGHRCTPFYLSGPVAADRYCFFMMASATLLGTSLYLANSML